MPHTPEPWEVDDAFIFAHDGGHLRRVVDCTSVDEKLMHSNEFANAERIVACVNACAEIRDPKQMRLDIQNMIYFIDGESTEEARSFSGMMQQRYPKPNG